MQKKVLNETTTNYEPVKYGLSHEHFVFDSRNHYSSYISKLCTM